jgi:hypothetical protein
MKTTTTNIQQIHITRVASALSAIALAALALAPFSTLPAEETPIPKPDGKPAEMTDPDGLLAHWAFESLENADGRVAIKDLVSGRRDLLRGHSRLHEGVRGSCLVLNEYDSELVRPAGGGPLVKGRAFTVEAWIAPRSYPWNWAPIVMQRDESAGFYFGIDGDGRLGLHVAAGGKWLECNSEMPFAGLLTEHQWNSDRRAWEYFGPGKPPHPRPSVTTPAGRRFPCSGGRMCSELSTRPKASGFSLMGNCWPRPRWMAGWCRRRTRS